MGFPDTAKTACVLSAMFLLLVPLWAGAGDLPQRITGKDGAPMVLIPGGSFTMGSADEDLKEFAPEHSVEITAFYMDVFEVTNERFALFLNARGFSEEEEKSRKTREGWVVLRSDLERKERRTMWPTEIIFENEEYFAFDGFESYPVTAVNWEAANAYCKWADKRLPSEAEWERTSRGGLEGKRFPWGDELPTGGVAYNRLWRDNFDPPPSEPVDSYLPNRYGVFNMAGNVWEWVSDWYHPSYYQESPKKNPRGPETGEFKVLKGGSWISDPSDLRVAARNFNPPYIADAGMGFRCAMDAEKILKENP
jgi:formylglycine-generating enzyme required for sulfatase activity